MSLEDILERARVRKEEKLERKRVYGKKWRTNNSEYIKNYREVNSESIREWASTYNKARYPLEREKHLNRHFMKKYGITLEERDKMLEAQGGCCKLCNKTSSVKNRKWHVDHCHVTGRIRGILCHNCNVMLANAKDNPDTLLAAIAYLAE